MSSEKKDPIGAAILAYHPKNTNHEIIVSSEICEDDTIPASLLFRSFEQMPDIEKLALTRCSGLILDIGAGTGVHAQHLIQQGLSVDCIDISPGSVAYMQQQGLTATLENFYDVHRTYDTLLMMMNGIGIAGSLSNLKRTLLHAKSMLTKNGRLLCDSTDIKYLYTDDDGALWLDLNTDYYGNFKFQMHYEDHHTDWFDWLYVDFDKLNEIAQQVGMKAKKIMEADHHYLAEITSADSN